MSILAEIPNDAGYVLWMGVREATLWASMEPGERHGFLADRVEQRIRMIQDSGMDSQVAAALIALTSTLRGGEADPEVLSRLCGSVAEWARQRGHGGTALNFAQAAALVDPASAWAAVEVAKRATELGQTARAETWLRRTIAVARRAGDWEPYTVAYLELGTMYRTHHQDPAQAERYFVRALRAARRKGFRELLGAARHGLFLLKVDAGELEEAAQLAGRAARAYGRGHPARHELARELAALSMRRGDHAAAAESLRALLPGARDRAERLRLEAMLARATAASGDLESYRASWMSAWELLYDLPAAGSAGPAMLELAAASALVGDVDRVQMIARAQSTLPARARRPTVVNDLLASARQNHRARA